MKEMFRVQQQFLHVKLSFIGDILLFLAAILAVLTPKDALRAVSLRIKHVVDELPHKNVIFEVGPKFHLFDDTNRTLCHFCEVARRS